jgi:hypothetical protein
MRRLFSKSDLQTLGLVMALVVLSTTLPLSIGTIIISDHGQPAITENICQPLQTFNLVFNTLLTCPAPAVPEFVLRDLGSAVPGETPRTVDHRETPDVPPPKLV